MGDSEDIEFHAPLGKPIPITAGGNANDDQTKNPDVTAAKSKARAGDFGPKLRVTLCILFAELCERLTYYGVTGNLLLFCTQELNMSSADGSTIVLVFGGVCYIVPIIGGWVADSISGKYNAIYGSALIYLVGTALLPLVALPYAKYSDDDKLGLNYQAKAIYFLFALIFISVGTGGIKSNVSPFGAEQVQALGPGAVRTFFNWFYWFINAGSVIAFSIVVYVQVEVNFFVGYLTPFVAMLVATFIFVIPKEKYVLCPPNGSVITDVLRVIHCAIKRKWRMRRQGILKTSSSIGLLDYARTTFGGRFTNGQVDAVVSLCRIVPIFATLILYWTVYRQDHKPRSDVVNRLREYDG